MLKLLGATIIIAASTLGGFMIARSYSERPKQLRTMQQALQMLETEIVYGSIPLHIAMRNIGNRIKGRIGSIFITMSDNLVGLDGESTYTCWSKAINKHYHQTALKKQDKEILLQFGHTLGISDKEDQMKHIRLTNQNLKQEENSALDDQRTYEKLSKNLGVLLGVLIVILLY